jgi:hypothetical protein
LSWCHPGSSSRCFARFRWRRPCALLRGWVAGLVCGRQGGTGAGCGCRLSLATPAAGGGPLGLPPVGCPRSASALHAWRRVSGVVCFRRGGAGAERGCRLSLVTPAAGGGPPGLPPVGCPRLTLGGGTRGLAASLVAGAPGGRQRSCWLTPLRLCGACWARVWGYGVCRPRLGTYALAGVGSLVGQSPGGLGAGWECGVRACCGLWVRPACCWLVWLCWRCFFLLYWCSRGRWCLAWLALLGGIPASSRARRSLRFFQCMARASPWVSGLFVPVSVSVPVPVFAACLRARLGSVIPVQKKKSTKDQRTSRTQPPESGHSRGARPS